MQLFNDQLHYQTIGSRNNPCLVFIHGFCEDLRMWEGLLEKGFTDYYCVLVDLPGFGKSPSSEQASIKGYAEQLVELLDHLKVSQFYAFGHSMGGYVSLALGELRPGRLRGLALINSHGLEDSPESKAGRQKSIDFINQFGSSLYVKQLIPALFPDRFSRSNGFLVDELTLHACQYSNEGITGGLSAMKSRPARTDVLTKTHTPVLVVVGELDELIDFDKLVDQGSYSSICQLEIIPGVGHMSPFESPERLRSIILEFLSFVKSTLSN
ncbi:MAG: alpha/beta hydrolase [Saprospiraceae bacterium]|nr:alpha/beta hydrolase [Saprospiraceae bacterium]